MKYELLDELDNKILSLLMKDSRLTYAEIGREINMSRVAVRERVNKMIETGVIERFSVIINPRKVGLSISAFFEIDVHPARLQEVAGALSKNEYVLSINQMTGPSTLHVHAALRNHEHLESFLLEVVYALPGINSVNSYMLIRGFKTKSGGIRIG